MRRVLTALALIPIVVYVVLGPSFWLFLAVLATVSCLCYREYNDIAATYGFGAPGPLGYGLGLLLLVWEGQPWLLLVAAALAAFTLALRLADLSKALPKSALLVTGIVYVFGCWKCALLLREASGHWLMYALLLNWVGDSGAYFVGRRFGKHKLAPQVSPKKSWEGAAASVATSILGAGWYLVHFVPSVPVLNAVLLTAAANVAGQVGDLAESAIKRGAGVKDSGSILPGHGGFLDRVDSTLFALPLIYAYLQWVG
ncbi:Phosphatidate cytidylyltransferase [Candidatus Sulfopaludibacter sp. SbA3]|nr:Phosphatidate cytidylyltransferase [Candidatus Sulfopaludibacter sp. SbA3]